MKPVTSSQLTPEQAAQAAQLLSAFPEGRLEIQDSDVVFVVDAIEGVPVRMNLGAPRHY